MKNLDKFPVLVSDSSILDVMKCMNEKGASIAFLVKENGKFHGIVTDGDIRRALIKNDKFDCIQKIMNMSPITVQKKTPYEEVVELLGKRHKFLPVLDDEDMLAGIYDESHFRLISDVKSRNICVLGMGYVGLTLSLVLADEGFKVFGYDINNTLIARLSNGTQTFFEHGIDTFLKTNVNKSFIPVSDLGEVCADTYIVTVGTPIEEVTKQPRIDYIEKAISSIAPHIKEGDLIILRSTVPVGTTRNVVLPILQKVINLEPGIDYFLAYAPERTVEGAALAEIRELPQIVGGYDGLSRTMAESLFKELTTTIISVDDLESAEMIKIMNNTFRDVKFAYANEMALICKDLGLDMVNLVSAANMGYTRDRIPVPSPGVGGACLSKDSYILSYSTKGIKSTAKLVEEARKVNEFIPLDMSNEIVSTLELLNKDVSNTKVFIMGFAFKGEPETSDMRGSTTLDLLQHLKNRSINKDMIFGYDPIVESKEIEALKITYSSIEEGFQNADVVVLMNNHHYFKTIDVLSLLKQSKEDVIFVDGWHMYNPSDIIKNTNYKYIGVGCKC